MPRSHNVVIFFGPAVQSGQGDWDQAQRLTAEASEQAKIAQQRKTSTIQYKQTAEEARAAAEDARNKQSQIEVRTQSQRPGLLLVLITTFWWTWLLVAPIVVPQHLHPFEKRFELQEQAHDCGFPRTSTFSQVAAAL